MRTDWRGLEGEWEASHFPASDDEKEDEDDADQPNWQDMGELGAETAGKEGCGDADGCDEEGLFGGVAQG